MESVPQRSKERLKPATRIDAGPAAFYNPDLPEGAQECKGN